MKKEELIDKFENGSERYRNSAQFKVVINCLLRGDDPLVIIDQLVKSNDEITKAFADSLTLKRNY